MSTLYFLQKGDMYYAHNSCGYVSTVVMAEIYTEEEAQRQSFQCEDVTAIPISERVSTKDAVQEWSI